MRGEDGREHSPEHGPQGGEEDRGGTASGHWGGVGWRDASDDKGLWRWADGAVCFRLRW